MRLSRCHAEHAACTAMNEHLRLLIVDDSALMRRVLRGMFTKDSGITVVGEAINGREALDLVARLRPDVITMDVRMPVMDGLETTEQLMAYYPTPILVLTASLSRYDVDITFKMLGAGALDVMEKPKLDDAHSYERARRELLRRIKLLSRVKVVTHLRGRRRAEQPYPDQDRHSGAAPLTTTHTLGQTQHQNREGAAWTMSQSVVHTPGMAIPGIAPSFKIPFPLVVIGASTGGPRIIRQILMGLPVTFRASILVVQHIAEGFSRGMVDWLASACQLPVRLACEGDQLTVGTVLVAPERLDLLVESNGRIHLNDKQLLLQRPAIDITMQSAAEMFGPQVIGILLTGMGRDGAVGMQSIHHAGGYTIAQEQASCTIFGMPRAAIELKAVDEVLSPEEIVLALQKRVVAMM